MKVAVLGGTGRTGRLLVEELLRRGHQVQVLARDPGRLGEVAGRVEVVQGDSRDAAALTRVVSGAEAVASALGPTGKEPDLLRDTAVALTAVMAEQGVSRFVGVSGAGIDLPGDSKSRRDRVISALIQRLGGEGVADKNAEHRVWAGSGLRWTLVRPPRLTDAPTTGRVEHHAHRSTRSTRIGRSDLASFVADVLEQDLYAEQAPFVAGEGRDRVRRLPVRRAARS